MNTPAAAPAKLPLLVLLALAVVYLVWGSTYLAIASRWRAIRRFSFQRCVSWLPAGFSMASFGCAATRVLRCASLAIPQ